MFKHQPKIEWPICPNHPEHRNMAKVYESYICVLCLEEMVKNYSKRVVVEYDS